MWTTITNLPSQKMRLVITNTNGYLEFIAETIDNQKTTSGEEGASSEQRQRREKKMSFRIQT